MAREGSKSAEQFEAALKKQLVRLKGYHGFDGLKDELLRVLKMAVKTEERAERIVTEIIDNTLPNDAGFLRCPSPAELTEIARAVPVLPPAPSGMVPADPGCPHCKGVGWKITRREISGYGIVEGAKECECRKAVQA